MFNILGIMFCGVGLGFLLRRKHAVKREANRLIMPVIFVLLFAMGISVGANKDVMQNLSTLGIEALIITVGAVVGSLVAAKVVYNVFFKNRDATDEK